MRALHRIFSLAAVLLLAGCGAVMLPDGPPVSAPETSRNEAVVALLDQAQTEFAAGRMDAADSSLERALRIEPRNPVLWQQLARVRLSQGNFRQAENLAAKSSTLAGDDKHLRSDNWRIIGQARKGLGDLQGAQAAFEMAEGDR